MSQKICVYCASSDNAPQPFVDLAATLGARIAQQGSTLVNGGSNVGLMRCTAESTQQHGGKVIGVIPALAKGTPYVYPADEVVYTTDLSERKAKMLQLADAFVALPGGFGTLDELAECIANKQMQLHKKPIVLLNALGFFDALIQFFERMYSDQLASGEHHRTLYYIAPDIDAVFAYLARYEPPQFPLRWF
jgi:hypothetical protein